VIDVYAEAKGARYEILDWDEADCGERINLSDEARALLPKDTLAELDAANHHHDKQMDGDWYAKHRQ
jgi:hypothetical protein